MNFHYVFFVSTLYISWMESKRWSMEQSMINPPLTLPLGQKRVLLKLEFIFSPWTKSWFTRSLNIRYGLDLTFKADVESLVRNKIASDMSFAYYIRLYFHCSWQAQWLLHWVDPCLYTLASLFPCCLKFLNF